MRSAIQSTKLSLESVCARIPTLFRDGPGRHVHHVELLPCTRPERTRFDEVGYTRSHAGQPGQGKNDHRIPTLHVG